MWEMARGPTKELMGVTCGRYDIFWQRKMGQKQWKRERIGAR